VFIIVSGNSQALVLKDSARKMIRSKEEAIKRYLEVFGRNPHKSLKLYEGKEVKIDKQPV
jgi:hypothetical protein